MRVLICGDRHWAGKTEIKVFIEQLPKDTIIIHGRARGADSLAGYYAREEGLEVIEFPAQWQVYGRSAGIIRNQQMLDEGKPDLVVYFHNNLANSRGTKDMVERATRAGIKVLSGMEEVHRILYGG